MTIASASILLGAIFIFLLTLLHFLKPELSPVWRMISEYEIGRFGWMMRLAFFSWGASALTLLITIWASLGSTGGIIGRWWFVLIVLALFGAGIFKTDPITEITNSRENTLHTLCGAVVILTFPIAATLVKNSLLQNSAWTTAQSQLTFGTFFIWFGMASFFASIIISRIIDPSAERVGPKVYLGWPNRFMVLTYVIWIMIVATNAIHIV
jgi:Protein of unknown function (DUF998)